MARRVIVPVLMLGCVVAGLYLLPSLTAVAQSAWADLGEGAPGENAINALIGIPGNSVVGGTFGSGSAYVFKYDIPRATFTPKLLVPGSGTYVSRLAWHPDGVVYVAASEAYGQGNLALYDPDSGQISDVGSFGDEYAEGMAVGADGKVYVSTCCQGRLSIYDPQTQTWTYKGTILPDQRRITALTLGHDGNIYGATSRFWLSPYGGAVLFKFDTTSQSTTVLGTIWLGTREVWNLVTNPVDNCLYGGVGYQMTPRLFRFDPAQPVLGITDLGEVPGPEENIGPGGLVVAVDGKIYGLVSNHLILYDVTLPGSGIVDLGEAGGGARPLTFGADARLYGALATDRTHLARNVMLFAPTLDLPFDYPGRTEESGRMFRTAYITRTNSVFDHNLPDNEENHEMVPYLGYDAASYPQQQFPCGPPNYECYDGHDAHDFSQTRAGEAVLAAAAGTIDDARTGCGFCLGCQVVIDHGNGFKTVYGHLRDEPDVTGQVYAGDAVGVIGNTYTPPCRSTGSHLHFAVEYNGAPFDPSGWLDTSHPDPWALAPGGRTSYNLWRHPVPSRETWSVVGQAGGTYTSASGSTTLDVPPGAFDGTWQFTFTDVPVANPSAQLKPTGHSFTLEGGEIRGMLRSSLALSAPLTLTVHYTDTEIFGLEEDTLQLYAWETDSLAWAPLSTTLHVTDNLALAHLGGPGLYALLAEDNDGEGPVITHPLFDDHVLSTEPLTVTVTISDASTGDHGVDSAVLYYSYTLPYTQAQVAGCGPGGNGDGVWTFEIPAQGEGREGSTLHFGIAATDGDLSPSQSQNDNNGSYFQVAIRSPIEASFVGSPTSGGRPLAVTFANQSTGDFTECNWRFGDGSASTSCADVVHTYATTGIFTVALAVGGLDGSDTLTRTGYITVAEPVVAGFAADPTTGATPLVVTFTNESMGDYDSCLWRFGDGGTSSTCGDPAHTYSAGGLYTPSLRVTGVGGTDTLTREHYITAYEAVSADFDGDPTTGLRPLTVRFTNSSTGDYSTCAWSFGDGATSRTCHDPEHTYTQTGVFSVSLAISGLGGTDVLTRPGYVTVDEPPPVAGFTGEPLAGAPPLMVAFTDTSTGSITTWLWDFGDGGTSTESNPSHVYTDTGDFTVTLTIAGPGGTDVEAKQGYVRVSHLPVIANFGADPTHGVAPLTVEFVDESSGPISAWLWTFGDGVTGTLTNPIHTYSSAGSYTVTLTVRGAGGEDMLVRENYIRVGEAYTVYLPLVLRGH